MKHIPIVSLRMVRERSVAYGARSLRDANDVYLLFKDLLGDLDREAFWIACRDSAGKLCCLSQISLGTINSALVHPREVFKVALLANAASVITVHNHPSGDPAPSHEDESITEILQTAALILGIRFHDHLIIGADGYYSFLESGRLE